MSDIAIIQHPLSFSAFYLLPELKILPAIVTQRLFKYNIPYLSSLPGKFIKLPFCIRQKHRRNLVIDYCSSLALRVSLPLPVPILRQSQNPVSNIDCLVKLMCYNKHCVRSIFLIFYCLAILKIKRKKHPLHLFPCSLIKSAKWLIKQKYFWLHD